MEIVDFWQRYDCNRVQPLDSFGQASVYAALDQESQARVAAKIAEIHPAFDNNAAYGERYLRASQLTHKNCIKYQAVYRSQIENTVHYALVMPLFSQGSLLNTRPNSDWSIVQQHDFLAQTAEALQYLHKAGFVVQNLHASHLLLQPTAEGYAPMLINYAQSERLPLAFIHNFEYIAPEQFGDDYQPTPQTDVWAFGVLAYWIFTGHLPFGKKAPQMPNRLIQQRILEDETPQLIERIPSPYGELIGQCLQKDVSARPKDLTEIIATFAALAPEKSLAIYTAPEANLIEQDDEDNPAPLWQRRFRRRPSRPINPLIVLLLIALAVLVGTLLNKL